MSKMFMNVKEVMEVLEVSESEYRWKTVGEVIKDLENNPGEYTSLSGERKKYIHMVPEGGNWRDLPEEIIPVAMGGAYQSGGGKVGFYRRLSYNQPAPTITTSPAQKATMLCHPTQSKRFLQLPENQ